MSRLRKGGKYKGASFAEQFNLAKGNKSPLFFAAIADATKTAVENAKSIVEEKMEDPEIQAMADAAKDSGPEDIIPKKIGSSSRRSARSDFFTRSAEKQEEKDAQEEAERLAKEKEEAEISPEDLIEKLNEDITSLKDQRLRAIAELENFRKLAEKDQSDALKYGISNFAKEIINIRDNIERAQSSISEEAKNNEAIKSVIEGIDLIAQSVITTFEKIGIKKIESLNEKFDHNLHQAMMEIENDDLEPGTIVQELIPGYTLHDRLLRPAMVGVSKKKKKDEEIADKPTSEGLES